jgi:hypothetical protein
MPQHAHTAVSVGELVQDTASLTVDQLITTQLDCAHIYIPIDCPYPYSHTATCMTHRPPLMLNTDADYWNK